MNIRYPIYEGVYRILTMIRFVVGFLPNLSPYSDTGYQPVSK